MWFGWLTGIVQLRAYFGSWPINGHSGRWSNDLRGYPVPGGRSVAFYVLERPFPTGAHPGSIKISGSNV